MRFGEGDVKTISKAISIQVVPAGKKENERNKIANQIKCIILLATCFGLNRTYLLKYRRSVKLLFFMYCVFVNIITVYFLTLYNTESTSFSMIQYTNVAEYISLVVIAMVSKKSSLQNLFENIHAFDSVFNINDDLNITLPMGRAWAWITCIFAYSILELISFMVYVFDKQETTKITAMTIWYVLLMTHDMEQLLFCTLLRTLFLRVCILKAHVAKELAFNIKEPKKKLDKVEELSNKAQLNISSLHRNYELLHKCAEQLNSIMSLPMMIMLLSSGLSSIMLLKNVFKALQSTTGDQEFQTTVTLYAAMRCLKYTMLVIISCYYSTVTTSRVYHLRTLLHDAMNSDQIDKLERRRIKAFFQLTRESEFAYALWGVIRLNMSLPLSYLSLCTTYLVIIIQFSKFID